MEESSVREGATVADLGSSALDTPSWVDAGMVDQIAAEMLTNGLEPSPEGVDVAFSFVIPTRSASPCIEAVRSIMRCRRQNGESVEVICAMGDSPSAQRNMAVRLSRGPHIGFLDDDCLISPDWMLRALDKLGSSSASVIGGPNLTPAESSFFSRCVGKLLASRFGTATMRARYAPVGEVVRSSGDERTTLCNMAFDREIFESFHFNETMFPNEENELLSRVRGDGHELVYDPKLVVTHPRKQTLRSFARQIFGYGFGRARQTKIQPRSLRPIHVLPTLTLAGSMALAASPILGASPVFPVLGALALVYLAVASLSGALIARDMRSWKALPLSLLLFPTLHLAYGAGFIAGLLPSRRQRGGRAGKHIRLLRLTVRDKGHHNP